MTIPINTYKSIADLINNSQDRGLNISLSLFNFRETLDDSEVIDTNIDKEWLYEEADNAYLKADQKHNTFSISLLNFVYNLQNHVSLEYGSVNNFLKDNNTTVFETFASISSATGFVINSENITSESAVC